ncbi:hemicentin-2 [Caerostris darwini]|uniref:Hemicentin-2 n=1 Tax=Caerostris darwini TaxID=1538125 RepID=A0AAV4QSR1_9ARAC|nr:hemicentin-2 [Caerostris darwini]
MKGVFLLGVIVFWTVVCNCEERWVENEVSNNDFQDTLSKELNRDFLFREEGDNLKKGDDCSAEGFTCGKNMECKDIEGTKKCDCIDDFVGDSCDVPNDCKEEIFQKCKGVNGTCTYDESEFSCKCEGTKILHPEDNACREPCKDDNDCNHGGSCADNKFCKCKAGVFGDKCEKIFDCTEGKYKNCEESGGECTYDDTKETSECKCLDNKKLDDVEHICKECNCGENGKCSFDKGEKKCQCDPGFLEEQGECKACDCGSKGQCSFVNSVKTCTCESGYIEDKGICKECVCGTNGQCTFKNGKKKCECDTGFYEDEETCKDCKCGEKGKECTFKEGVKSCVCEEGYVDKQGTCAKPCTDDKECKYGGTCSNAVNSKKFCVCKQGLEGDQCDIIVDCNGKYKNCTGEKGNCEYDVGEEKAVCKCKDNKKLDDKENICKECICGANANQCSFESGKKICECKDGYSQKVGTCEECKCGENGIKCSFKGSVKTCDCEDGYGDKKGTCTEKCTDDGGCENGGSCKGKDDNKFCECGDELTGAKCEIVLKCTTGIYKNCKGDNGTCSYDVEKKAAKCECADDKILHDKENICKECDCGGNGKCSFVKGIKNCACDDDYKEKVTDGKCHECNCGNQGTCKFELDKKICTCKANFTEKDGTCQECNCGIYGKCSFDTNGAKKCNCNPTFSEDDEGVCQECDCGKFGECYFMDGEKACNCKKNYKEYNGKCKECNCGDGGECSFKDDGTPRCDCNAGYDIKTEGGKPTCTETCEKDEDCKNGGSCKGEKDKSRFCVCKSAFEGDKCEVIKECKIEKFKKCVASGGSCELNKENKVVCNCGSKQLDTTTDICREKCSDDDECKNGAKCVKELCVCKSGTSGDKCEIIDNCKDLQCENKNASCDYDAAEKGGVCNCLDKDYYFERECKPKWCRDNKCSPDSTCKFENGIGTCKCNKEKFYYDYSAGSCREIDKCIGKKCEDNKVCENGECKCKSGFKENKGNCEREKACEKKSSPCFEGAKCIEGEAGKVICQCSKESDFYNAKTRKCEDGSCVLPNHKVNCTLCPSGMKRKDGDCVAPEDKKCSKVCGPFGWCIKKKDKEECVCVPTFAKLVGDKCVLETSKVCPTNDVNKVDPTKCNCTGGYKFAANGITCEKKACSDNDVKEECSSSGAVACIDDWKKTATYRCVCDEDSDLINKVCSDTCSKEDIKTGCATSGRLCFSGACKCPPTFTFNEQKKICEDRDRQIEFMLRSLPVVSTKYVNNKYVNKVRLNKDIAESMMQAIINLEYVHLFNYKIEDGVLNCNVWLQFKSTGLPTDFNTTVEVSRWKDQIKKEDNEIILPPRLLLSDSYESAATEEKLSFCSDSVKLSLCGKNTDCKEDKKCECKEGYRAVDSTSKKSASGKVTVICEDIDECLEETHKCTGNSTCQNTPGGYFCKCKPGYKKESGDPDALDQTPCNNLCEPNPCVKGSCLVKDNKIDCTCNLGVSGSFCNKEDKYLQKAKQSTTVVGAVLGTLLAVVVVLILVYVIKKRQNTYSEDFTPAPRVDNAEMVERRPMRGVTNRGYQ